MIGACAAGRRVYPKIAPVKWRQVETDLARPGSRKPRHMPGHPGRAGGDRKKFRRNQADADQER